MIFGAPTRLHVMKQGLLLTCIVLAISCAQTRAESDIGFNDIVLAYWETVFIANLCDPYIPTGNPFVVDQISDELKGFGLEEAEVQEILFSARRRGEKASSILIEEQSENPNAVVLYCGEQYQERLDKLNDIRKTILPKDK